MKWSILIPTVPARRSLLQRLMRDLDRQVEAYPDVEVLVLEDNRKRNYGDKMQSLIDIARGEYVSFVDDDDRIAMNYVEAIRHKLTMQPDCVGFYGQYSENGSPARTVEYSLNNRVWQDLPDMYKRAPQHITPIRTDLVRQVRWDGGYGADRSWSQRMMESDLLQKEIFLPHVLYFYDYRSDTRKGVWVD